MHTSRWAPTVVPGWADQTVYIVENDFGPAGRAFVETDGEHADLEATIVASWKVNLAILSVSLHSTPRNDGRKMFPRTLLTRCAADATCSFATCLPLFRILLSATRGSGSLRCG